MLLQFLVGLNRTFGWRKKKQKQKQKQRLQQKQQLQPARGYPWDILRDATVQHLKDLGATTKAKLASFLLHRHPGAFEAAGGKGKWARILQGPFLLTKTDDHVVVGLDQGKLEEYHKQQEAEAEAIQDPAAILREAAIDHLESSDNKGCGAPHADYLSGLQDMFKERQPAAMRAAMALGKHRWMDFLQGGPFMRRPGSSVVYLTTHRSGQPVLRDVRQARTLLRQAAIECLKEAKYGSMDLGPGSMRVEELRAKLDRSARAALSVMEHQRGGWSSILRDPPFLLVGPEPHWYISPFAQLVIEPDMRSVVLVRSAATQAEQQLAAAATGQGSGQRKRKGGPPGQGLWKKKKLKKDLVRGCISAGMRRAGRRWRSLGKHEGKGLPSDDTQQVTRSRWGPLAYRLWWVRTLLTPGPVWVAQLAQHGQGVRAGVLARMKWHMHHGVARWDACCKACCTVMI